MKAPTISFKLYDIGFERVDDSRDRLPTRSTARSAGYDLFASASMQTVHLPPGGTLAVPTGLFLSLKEKSGPPADLLSGSGWQLALEVFPYLQVCSRSGLATKGVFVTNAPGIVDIDYKGEIKVILTNGGETALTINGGDKIAQLIPVAGYQFWRYKDRWGDEEEIVVPSVINLTNTVTLAAERGAGGFGSTDKEQVKKLGEGFAPLPREQIEGTSTV
jgi:dUTP pyrophosphatase